MLLCYDIHIWRLTRMDIDKINIRPQPYSKALRDIARILEERESDAQALEQLRIFLIRSGIPVKEPGQAPPRERKW